MDKKLTSSELLHIAELAKLELCEEEKEKLLRDFEDMLFFAEKINDADIFVENSETSRLYNLNSLREDKPSPSFPREVLLGGAPTHTDSYVTVPNIIEE
ncbi:MAG: Asp-tRNA(Asn)/Glu-tRNA(Gln) amidotransferase subunit GatC [Clostridia bacterium]|nr:Asp-tRNA(Asn)/Glu-tRNA(Gln) amidotransferase subunit GatC [Clostridia bacterium]